MFNINYDSNIVFNVCDFNVCVYVYNKTNNDNGKMNHVKIKCLIYIFHIMYKYTE